MGECHVALHSLLFLYTICCCPFLPPSLPLRFISMASNSIHTVAVKNVSTSSASFRMARDTSVLGHSVADHAWIRPRSVRRQTAAMIFRQIVLFVAAILYSTICAAADQPNIVYILADDMGTGDVSCFNPESKIETANLDRLAAVGVKFTDAHSGSSVCTPTRYGLLTGRYSWRTLLKERVLNSYSPCLIPQERDTVASLLKRHGYTTAIIGKWHLGLDWTPKEGKSEVNSEEDVDFAQPIKHGPLDLGFDHWYGVAASWDMAPYAFIEDRMILGPLVPTTKGDLFPRPQEYLAAREAGKDKEALKSIMKKYPKASWRRGLMTRGMKATDAMPLITSRAVQYIGQQHRDKPFFLYLPLTATHTPVVPGRVVSWEKFGWLLR